MPGPPKKIKNKNLASRRLMSATAMEKYVVLYPVSDQSQCTDPEPTDYRFFWKDLPKPQIHKIKIPLIHSQRSVQLLTRLTMHWSQWKI